MRPSMGFLAVAVGIVLGGLAWWWTLEAPPATVAAVAPAPAVVTASVPASPPVSGPSGPVVIVSPASPASPATPVAVPGAEPQQRVGRNRDPDGDHTPDLSDYVNPGEQPSMAQVIGRLNQAGVHTGLGAFSPPGTKPPLVGLAVPEDFPLPEGYVRHHQATDDGQRIEAILMFAPDRQVLDAAGRPIAVPKDRVVPPEYAPPGLPIRRVSIPAPAEPGRPGS